MSKSDDIQVSQLSQEMEQKQLILYGHPDNVKARSKKAPKEKTAETPSAGSDRIPKDFNQLVDDLVSFVKTGRGPSDFLDAEMKKDKHLYAELTLNIANACKLGFYLSPLEYSLRKLPYSKVFEYLLTNGADYSHNPLDQKTLPLFLISNQDLLFDKAEPLFEAGYFAITSHMTKIVYQWPSIAFREKFDKKIWKGFPSEFASMNERVFEECCYRDNPTGAEYCYQQGINIELLEKKEALLKRVCSFGHLETVKYLLHHGEYSLSQIIDALMRALESEQVQIVNYLIHYFEFKNIPKKQYFLQLKNKLEKFDNPAVTYFRYLNPDLSVGGQVSKEKLAAFQEYQFKQMEKVLEVAMKYFKNELDMGLIFNEMKLMQLALTHNPVSEEKSEISTLALRLTAISHLPLIDRFAVTYAMYRAEFSMQKNTTSIELGLLANFYNQYLKNTAHIKTSVRENLHYWLNWKTREDRPNDLLDIQEASEGDLILCPPQNTGKQLLLKPLSWLVVEYLILPTGRTPALFHMLRALKSNEKCLQCETVLLSTKQEIIFLGSKNKEAKSQTSSPKTSFETYETTFS